MVASSRSSLRRPALRGDHNTSRSTSPIASDHTPKSANDTSGSKRPRVTSISDRDRGQLQKRRKIGTKSERDEFRIPLRAKEANAENIVTAPLTRAIPSLQTITTTSSSTSSPLDSPSIKPQYDQIKRIEEKARAAIKKENAHPERKDERRRLRSEHGGSRAKTELAQYFPNFDEMLSLEPSRQDSLTVRTRLMIIDDTPEFTPEDARQDPFGAHKPLHNVALLDMPISSIPSRHITHDPLGPDVYYKAHRKAERHEKQMKNGDKERAQHEKYQLDKLLDELRGPDWLKTLGITGITDTEKKRYEPKRVLFIRETKALIEKFKRWKEEEKRRKLEKEQAHFEDQEAEETEAARSTSTRRPRKKERERVPSKPQSETSSDKGPGSTEFDLLASQQLWQEANSASSRRKKATIVETDLPSTVPPLPPPLPEAHKPFTSFFEKRHIRDAAVAGRQRGRTVLAFGEPIPDMMDDDFELPDSILTEEAIRASQRNRRRTKRGLDS